MTLNSEIPMNVKKFRYRYSPDFSGELITCHVIKNMRRREMNTQNQTTQRILIHREVIPVHNEAMSDII